MNLIQREGIDRDPVKPYQWATLPLGHRVEIMSYPVPADGESGIIDRDATIMIRTMIGDPTSLREVPFRNVAVFHPSRCNWEQ